MNIRMAGLLDNFYLEKTKAGRYARIAEEPARVADARTNAMMGAIGEHLCRRWHLGNPPEWTEQAFRFLDSPYYNCSDEMRRFAFFESPIAFRRRFIFIEAEPLRRARTPRDDRWWAYEEMRTGMKPGPGEIEPGP